MRQNWVELSEFPDYAVSDHGEIANMKTGAPRKTSLNQQGIRMVTLYQENGRPATRSLAVLVARCFIPQTEEHFDTPIHLNGDRLDCRAVNLMWRPRWFAIRFHKQFMFDTFHDWPIHLVDLDSGQEYRSIKEVCTHNGLYFQDVVKSYNEYTFVIPTYQEFRRASEVM